MSGKVFISCGQRGSETKIAEEIEKILKDEFSLTSYLAFKIQSLSDIMTITNELRSSDYYLFIDFFRRPDNPEDLSVSLFTHQELALAHNLGFQDMIAFCQEGVKREGFINYVLSNPEPFKDENELYGKIKKFVKEKGWSKDFSRNLVLSNAIFSEPINYRDHIGSSIERVFKIEVENKRPDRAAVRTICILDYIKSESGNNFSSPDRSNLKWVWQVDYYKTILPNDSGGVDLFSIHASQPGIFLHSLRDFVREPIVSENGKYEFYYKLFAEGFPMLKFCISINLQWEIASQYQPLDWGFKTTAELSELKVET